MLHWFGLAFVAAAVLLAARWTLARRLGSVAAFPWKGPLSLLVIGALAVTPWVLRMRLELRLAEAAGEIAGREVAIQCQSFAAAFVDPTADPGHVAFQADGGTEAKALIKRDQCRALSAYLSSDKQNPTHDQVVAVHVLTHEAMHMSGITSESEAECRALSNDARMAELLGASEQEALALAATYRREVYPDMPADYRVESCAAAG
ncbi:MAG: hypothetical protein M3174_01450 [Actinomycetota bacterium]|nr:hypothetical protein [Actinomycetota bacterium]